MNIVMITSGLNEISSQFHSLKGHPVAIIELAEWGVKRQSMVIIRRLLRLMFPRKYSDLSHYCQQNNIRHYRASRRDKLALKPILDQVSAELVITYQSPVLPVSLFDDLEHGAINLHSALLPQYRGGNPIYWQVIHGEKEVGVTVHRLTERVDEGPILAQAQSLRPKYISYRELNRYIEIECGYPALSRAVTAIEQGTAEDSLQTQMDTADLIKAPHCNWSDWQRHVDDSKLTADHVRDIEHFIGS